MSTRVEQHVDRSVASAIQNSQSCSDGAPRLKPVPKNHKHGAPIESSEVNSGKEAKKKSSQGIISSALNDVTAIAGGVYAASRAVGSIVAPAMQGLAVLGLNKPTTLNATQVVKQNPFFDINQGRGLDLAPKMGFDPEMCITTAPIVGGLSEPEMSLAYIAGKPMICNVITISGDTVSANIGTLGPSNSSNPGEGMTYCDFLCGNFAYWSGSHKWMAAIYCTPDVVSARLTIQLQHSNLAVQSSSDLISLVIEAGRDEIVTFTTPFVSTLPAERSQNAAAAPYNATDTLSLVVDQWGSTYVNSVIYLVLYKAMDDDCQFYIPLANGFQANMCPEEVFKNKFPPMHVSCTSYRSERVIGGGVPCTHLSDVLHIMSPWKNLFQGTLTTTVMPVGGNISAKVYEGWYKFLAIFLQWRGSIRFRVLISSSSRMAGCYLTSSTFGQIQALALSSPTNPVLEGEIPYYYNTFYRFVKEGADTTLNVSSFGNKFLLTSTGDDFTLSWLCPPPPGVFVVGTAHPALMSYLAAPPLTSQIPPSPRGPPLSPYEPSEDSEHYDST